MASLYFLKCLKYLIGFFLIAPTSGLHILGIFPHNGISHFIFNHPIMRELAAVGHNVTVVSYFPDKNAPPNYKDIVLTGDVLTNSGTLDVMTRYNNYIGHFIEAYEMRYGIKSCKDVYGSPEIKEILKNNENTFDLLIMEQFHTDCMLGIAWKLQIPVIGTSSCALMPWHYDRVGNPAIPSYIPELFMGYSDKMTFLERLSNWLAVHGIKFIHSLV